MADAFCCLKQNMTKLFGLKQQNTPGVLLDTNQSVVYGIPYPENKHS